MDLFSMTQRPWFSVVHADVKNLLLQAVWLSEQCLVKDKENKALDDYAFLVFPAAKGYEGFLLWWFCHMEVRPSQVCYSDHFRIGRALNPDLPEKYRNHHWLFDDVSQICGRDLAMQLWYAWKQCRNQIFHFKHERKQLTFEQAQDRVFQLFIAMEAAEQCLFVQEKD